MTHARNRHSDQYSVKNIKATCHRVTFCARLEFAHVRVRHYAYILDNKLNCICCPVTLCIKNFIYDQSLESAPAGTTARFGAQNWIFIGQKPPYRPSIPAGKSFSTGPLAFLGLTLSNGTGNIFSESPCYKTPYISTRKKIDDLLSFSKPFDFQSIYVVKIRTRINFIIASRRVKLLVTVRKINAEFLIHTNLSVSLSVCL